MDGSVNEGSRDPRGMGLVVVGILLLAGILLIGWFVADDGEDEDASGTSSIREGSVGTDALADRAVTAEKLGEECQEGQILRHQAGAWSCSLLPAAGEDDLDTSDLQTRITGACGSSQAVREVHDDGSVDCETVTGGGGGTAGEAWLLGGNGGLDPDPAQPSEYLGTSDEAPLRFAVDDAYVAGFFPTDGPANVLLGQGHDVGDEAEGVLLAGQDHQTAFSSNAAAVGGESNEAWGANSFVAGGMNNEASGDGSFAGGTGAQAEHHGSFVWSDRSQTFAMATRTSGENQFIVEATGGVGINTSAPRAELDVDGDVHLSDDGAKLSFDDETVQRTAGPVAKGVVDEDGSLIDGVNIEAVEWDESAEQYQIDLAGIDYDYREHATTVTSLGDPVAFGTSSLGGQQLVVNPAGGQQQAFQFVTHDVSG